jgi:peroxiredoxin
MKTKRVIAGLAFLVIIASCKTTAPAVGVLNGEIAPEVTAVLMDGKSVNLSASRGKLVLLEFWDSNNSVARKNHFEMQRMYSKFKNTEFKSGNGFEIYSLSIDTDVAAWKNAVAADGISWPIIVNDKAGWNAKPALDYKIASLPKYFLIDENGLIISHNIIISDLEKLLNSLKD